jgi:hypothetical protein
LLTSGNFLAARAMAILKNIYIAADFIAGFFTETATASVFA